ncbi:glyoxylase-like metal-dependent hydrolase (beta-lactamase superfamily II) [Kineococcus radiotolerans]|uniref:Glyoxylase-like metal-dependent hydrolase (Beta-lactamase superfamily II) n=1 Tax=Kineococcus radiotolerans TaxID=131568 RepID=A0A7W4TK72_KINRA|nr:MBL fold metallo-hydrolase [Kineococcus radiotolerans]MBB2900411.1 glyoxylase-like metal-dependent hydrolase (beta-lactamase superfamily II) [Kineococcus radiotolerans]
MSARIEHLVTSGTFSLDGQTFDVDNNVWIVGDDREVVVLDAPHDVDVIAAAIGERTLLAVLCTHAHDDHVRRAPALAERFSTPERRVPVLLHPADREVWDLTHPGVATTDLSHGEVVTVAGTELHVLHTPGHTPGAVSVYAPELSTVFTGDTLFAGGPGATGRSFSDFATIVDSIRDVLFELPADTRVHTGHGEDTTIGDESPHLQEWIARGH